MIQLNSGNQYIQVEDVQQTIELQQAANVIISDLTDIDYLNFNTDPTEPAYAEGNVYWDNLDKTLSIQQGIDNVTLQVGQEFYIRARNSTGSTIQNGKAVYIAGATGNRPNIALARADTAETAQEIGITTHEIENNTDGLVAVAGKVRGVDTSDYDEGDTLYVSHTVAGELTNVPPPSPNFDVQVGKVITVNPSVGSILVSTLPFKSGVQSIDSARIHQDAEFTLSSKGPVLIDRTNGNRYRLFMSNGVLGTELI